MTCDFSPLTPLVGAIVGAPFPISVEARFPVRTGAIANIGGSSTLPPPGSPFAAFTVTGVTGGTVDGSGNVTGTAPVTVSVLDGFGQRADVRLGLGRRLHPRLHRGAAAAHVHGHVDVHAVADRRELPGVRDHVDHREPRRDAHAHAAPPARPCSRSMATPVGVAPQVEGGGPLAP